MLGYKRALLDRSIKNFYVTQEFWSLKLKKECVISYYCLISLVMVSALFLIFALCKIRKEMVHNKDLLVNSKIMCIHILMLVINTLVDLSLIAIIKGDGPFENPDVFAAAEFFYFVFQNVI